MRITTGMMYDRSLSSLMKSNERLSKATDQANTLEKFTTAGESPTGMAQKLNLTAEIAKYKQYASNGTNVQGKLTQEESVLDSLNTAMGSAYTKVQQIVNGTNNSTDDREALASELEELQKHMLDLMNSRDDSGEYLFSGSQSKTPAFALDSSGQYQYQGDSGQRFGQVSQTVKIATSDPGDSVFQNVATARTASSSTMSSISVGDNSAFSSFYASHYDPANSANNTFTVATVAGSPDTYQIKDAGGNVLQSGNYTQGDEISFNGLKLNPGVASGSSTSFALDAPSSDNVLNSLGKMIAALRDPTQTTDQINTLAASTQVHLSNSQNSVNQTIGTVGARLSSLDAITNSNTNLSGISQDKKAEVSEVDLYEAITNLTKENNALDMARKSYAMINKSTLFDYL